MKLELETRICRCGCKSKFKVLPSSSQKYASKACLELAPRGRRTAWEKYTGAGPLKPLSGRS